MSLLHIAGGGTSADAPLDSSSVFSTYLYTGNGSTQTINNGIDLAGKGGMVWLKNRTSSGTNNRIFDTARGISAGSTSTLTTNNTAAQVIYTNGVGVNNVYSNGFGMGSSGLDMNNSAQSYVSWTFRKAPKFFDVVTYTGNGVAGRQIPHALGVEPGMIIVKRVDSTSQWPVFHRSTGSGRVSYLNNTDSAGFYSYPDYWSMSDMTFSVPPSDANVNGATYVAYLFAHDDSEDGIIQCGSFTTDGSGNATVDLGWEPQYLMVKAVSTTSSWYMLDTMRGLTNGSIDAYLLANLANAEVSSSNYWEPTATGFEQKNMLGAGVTHIYMAIRRPNKVPTSGTEVYNAIARTGTGAVATVTGVGFAPDLIVDQIRSGDLSQGCNYTDSLRGVLKQLVSSNTNAEGSATNAVISIEMDGMKVDNYNGINASGEPYINHFFKRAKGFMDIVCYTGTGVARTVNHNLGVVPELMIVKCRAGSSTYNWVVSDFANGVDNFLNLNLNGATQYIPSIIWNSTLPTSSVFSLGTAGGVNQSGYTYVWYGFASLPGISKVGSYTGNGTSQTINCGFSSGARFILIKRTDSTGDWYIWDTVRGIVAGNDPHLSLNTTEVEVTTDDSIDPESSGFIVNQNTATNINVNGGSYIFLAIA